MTNLTFATVLFCCLFIAFVFILLLDNRSYKSSKSVANAYDKWTNDYLLERLWGEHIHLGYYKQSPKKPDFRQAKIDFVHELVRWSSLNSLPTGSRILDVGCGIGGSSRILARDYGFDVLGITISSAQVERARELTPAGMNCSFEVMDALDLAFKDETFDGIWSVEAGPHMPNKQLYADEMLRVLRPGGVLSVADWNIREIENKPLTLYEKLILKQLLNQWAHPEFSSINSFKKNLLESPYNLSEVETEDWTRFTLPSWNDSIFEGIRRPLDILSLGGNAFLKGFREIPTILLMRWAFSNYLMRFGVFKISSK
ncbi:methyltransferase domain-containing protein [Prochlorococcus sp. MIT 1223]|uniref:methyltransferase domain-containing protein n=1 Tax=Prochlorococcus sp. MIT 1223 TaxID=3096217 RepID=UPI002A760F2E|nr:methyltransferase domain-containing protein [Prochlorococcus sp. MIT 1223]